MRNFFLGFALVITVSFSLISISYARLNNNTGGANRALSNLDSTSINTDLLPDGNNTRDLGAFDSAWNDLFVSGTAYIDTLAIITSVTSTGDIIPDPNNVHDLGAYDFAWKDIFASGTMFTSFLEVDTTSTAKVVVFSPNGNQVIITAGDTINAEMYSHYSISTTTDTIMTSTPTIPDGKGGQILFLHNTSTSATIDLQDEGVLGGSNILVNGASNTIKPLSVMTLLFDETSSAWLIVSNPNQASAGANADLLSVRNVTGSAIAAGKAVYATGYNDAQGRVTIGLADADDSTKMPAIGITSASISNNTNGDIITNGTVTGIINTSGQAVNQGVWVGTTAGALVFTRPTVDQIQKIGTITKVNASGNILVQGAGRANDIPIDLGSFTTPYQDAYASGTSFLSSVTSTMIEPWMNDTSDLGSYTNSWKNVYVSSSLFIGGDGSATSTVIANGLEASVLNLTSVSVSSTFSNGLVLAGGCIEYPDGTCLVPGGGGADTALSNLSGVAINESLISDALNIDSLGSFTFPWKNIYVSSTAYLDYVSSTAMDLGLLTMSGNVVMTDNSITGIDTLTFTDTAGTIAGIQNGNLADLSAANTWTGLNEYLRVSSTILSVFNEAFFGATATSTFDSTGALTMAASVKSDANDTDDLGGFGNAWKSLYVSSTSKFGDNSASSSIDIDRRGIYEIDYKTIVITSSTLEAYEGLTASSTINLGVASPHGEDWDSISCYTDSSTAEIEFGDGTNWMDYQKVTTAAAIDISLSNNSFISREKRSFRVGQWSTANTLTCTIGIIELQD